MCLLSNKKPSEYKDHLEYLKDFASGPCSPTIILPGILGSKLRIKINCVRFSKNFPNIFKACGWKMCKGLYLFKPSKEYTIWIPGIKGASKGFFLRPNNCLAQLLNLRINSKFNAEDIKKYKKSK